MSRTNSDLVTPLGISNVTKLKRLGVSAGKDVDAVYMRFTLEAAIRRLFRDELQEQLGLQASLKGGALMFFSEGVEPIYGRNTSDIDLQVSNFEGTAAAFAQILKDAFARLPDPDDGVRFDVDNLKVAASRVTGVPGGAFQTRAQIGTAVINFKCDVGFYNPEIGATLEHVEYPSLLSHLPSVPLWRQPVEYSIADKIHAAVRHGKQNTRLRDLYDLYVFARRHPIDYAKLDEAMKFTFDLFETELPASPERLGIFSPEFVELNGKDWTDFRERSKWAIEVPDLRETLDTIYAAIAPAFSQADRNKDAGPDAPGI